MKFIRYFIVLPVGGSLFYEMGSSSIKCTGSLSDKQFCRKYERICSHAKLVGRFNQSSISEEHMPDEHKLYAEEWNPERLKKWAASVGASCLAVIESMLDSKPHPAMAYRSCLGVLSYAKNKGNAYLEQLCETAIATSSAPSYKQIKMLSKKPPGEAAKLGPHQLSSVSSIGDSGLTRGAASFRLED